MDSIIAKDYAGRRKTILLVSSLVYLLTFVGLLGTLVVVCWKFAPISLFVVLGISCILGLLGIMSPSEPIPGRESHGSILGGFGFFWPFSAAHLVAMGLFGVVLKNGTELLLGEKEVEELPENEKITL